MNLDSSLVVEAAFLDCCPSTSSSNVTFVIRVSRRHADAFASRPDILSRAGLLVKFGRDFRSDDPICDHLVDWQQQQQTAPRGIESIVLQGPIEQLKEVAIHLVQDVWLPRRMKSKMAQVHIPLRDANTALAPYISRGKFSKIAEDSEAVIAFEVSPQGTSFYQCCRDSARLDFDSTSVDSDSTLTYYMAKSEPRVATSTRLSTQVGFKSGDIGQFYRSIGSVECTI